MVNRLSSPHLPFSRLIPVLILTPNIDKEISCIIKRERV